VRQRLEDQRGQRPIACYSDHHTDLPLLRFAHRPIAVNPTRQLRQAAIRLGMPIEDWEAQPAASARPRTTTSI